MSSSRLLDILMIDLKSNDDPIVEMDKIGQRVLCMHPMRMQRIWATDLRNWNVSGTHRADRANRKIE